MPSELNNIELTTENLSAIAKQIIELDPVCRVFLFDAPMGAGKTTLIKEMCRMLGSSDNLSSPTYSIVNEYSYSGGRIFHLDLYRLKSKEEVLDIGVEDYFDSGNYCFIEWPELAMDLIETPCLKISIIVKDNFRYLSAAKHNP